MIKLILKYLPSVVLPTTISLLLVIIYGNYLSPESYGQYSLFITTIIIFDSLFFYFMSASILRFYNSYNQNNNKNKLISTFLLLSFILLVVLAVILTIFMREIGFYFTICLAGFALINIISNYLRASEKVITYNFIKVLPPITTLVLILLLLKYGFLNTSTAITSYYIPMFVISLIFIGIFLRNKLISLVISKEVINESIKYGLPLTTVGLLNVLLSSSDRYMISYFLDNEQVGYYSFSYKLAEISLLSITMVIIMAMFPHLIRVYEEKGKEKANQIISKYFNLHLMIMIPMLFLIFIYIDELVNILFSQYEQATDIIKYASLGVLLLSVSYFTNKGFELTKKTKEMMIILIITAVINFLLNLLLLPFYGTMGAVIATFISYFIYLIISLFRTKTWIKINFSKRNFILIMISNVVPTFIISSLTIMFFNNELLNTFSSILIYLIIYIMCILFFFKTKLYTKI